MQRQINIVLLSVLTALLSVTDLLAQPEGESPYSSSEGGAIDNPDIWSQPLILILGAVIFGGFIIYLIAKRRRA